MKETYIDTLLQKRGLHIEINEDFITIGTNGLSVSLPAMSVEQQKELGSWIVDNAE
jgi:hypothetical protein